MSDSRLLDSARQGDPRAISTLLNAVLLPKRVKATVVRQAEELMITLHSEKMLNQGAAVTLIRTALEKLHLPEIQRVFIESRVLGVPLWESHFSLQVIPPPPQTMAEDEDPWSTETAPTEPSSPEAVLPNLMSAFIASEESSTSESQDAEARSPQEGSLDEVPEIDPEADISLADLAAAFDPNPPSELPDANGEEPVSNLPSSQGECIESDTPEGFSGELPVLAVAAEPLSSPVEEPLDPIEESIATPEAQASVPEIPELSEATPPQVSIEEYNFSEPTPEDLAALDTLEIESSAPVEMPSEAESSPEGAIAPSPIVEDPGVVSDTLLTAPTAPREPPPQAPEAVSYPPLRDPWLEAEPAPQVQADKTQETPPPETARASPPPPSESEIYTTPMLERVPRNGLTRATAIVGILMGLGFCATLLGAIIGLPLLVGSLCMLAEEEVWQGECPHCHQPLKIPVGKLWRFSCEKCQGLIEVKHGRFYARATPPAP